MKILLLGDNSGFSKNLKEGLIELGHHVDLATSGDGYKQTVKTDIYFPMSGNSTKRNIEKLLFPFTIIKKYYYYDVVQMAYDNMFGGVAFNYNYWIMKKIKKKSGKLFLSSCGTNYFVYNIKDKLRYNYVDENIEIDRNGVNPYIEKKYVNNNIRIANLVDGIIPTAYTYAEAYREYTKLLNTIPLPINTNKIKFIPQNIENNKLKIFHGITREGFKGTKYIKEAMLKLKEKYPNDVEIIIDGKMPLKKYLKVLEETNIIVDQALSYEYGMNAIYSMAMGKVVLSGNEPECGKEFGRSDIPIINIKPSSENIYNQLEQLVLNKKAVIEIGKKSRAFVEEFHDHVKVAQIYVNTWNNIEVRNKNE